MEDTTLPQARNKKEGHENSNIFNNGLEYCQQNTPRKGETSNVWVVRRKLFLNTYIIKS